MKKPGFSVVTLVCAVLGVFGMLVREARPHLPPQPANQLRFEADEYLRQGANQQIDWRLLDAAVFAEAKRLERPVMIVMGTVGSRDARLADYHAFSDQDVQSFLDRNFLSVRVDLDAQPWWQNALLPLTRASFGISPSFQVWFVDPSGRMFDFLGSGGFVSLSDPLQFLDGLAAARNRFDAHLREPGPNLHDEDVATFRQAPVAGMNLVEYSNSLIERIDPIWGGFPSGQTQTTRSNAFQMLLLAGKLDEVKLAMTPMLRSGLVDWLDGGFFRRSRKRDWTDVEFDKLATSNAEAMRVAATYGVLMQDPMSERIAKNTFDTLVEDFAEEGLISTARIGDESLVSRSRKASFSAKDLRTFWGTGLLSPSEALGARRMLGLEVETNPQMNIRVSDPGAFDDPSFEAILSKLRTHKKTVRTRYSKAASAAVNGFATAALLWSARLWGDETRLHLASERFETLDVFGSSQDITHHTNQRQGDEPFLGDYLSIAEACLEQYMNTGDPRTLLRGHKIMMRARLLFGSPLGWTPSTGKTESLLPGSNVPQVVDSNYESLYARSIRVAFAYGRLLQGGRLAKDAAVLSQDAVDMAGKGAFLTTFGPATAGFCAAAATLIDDAYAVATGPGAVKLSASLFRLRPTRLVAPARGPVRTDLQNRGDGLFVVSQGQATGPYSLEEAAKRLDWKFAL